MNLCYRGISFPAQVTSFLEEYDLKVAAFLKGMGVQKLLVPALFCENDLTIADEPRFEHDISPQLLVEATLARGEATNFVENPEKATALEIKTALTAQHRVLSALDRTWKVELHFWLSQCGQTGETRLKNQALSYLPTCDVDVSLQTSNNGLKKLLNSKLYQFVGAGLQAELSSVSSWITSLHANRCHACPRRQLRALSTNRSFIVCLSLCGVKSWASQLWVGLPSFTCSPG